MPLINTARRRRRASGRRQRRTDALDECGVQRGVSGAVQRRASTRLADSTPASAASTEPTPPRRGDRTGGHCQRRDWPAHCQKNAFGRAPPRTGQGKQYLGRFHGVIRGTTCVTAWEPSRESVVGSGARGQSRGPRREPRNFVSPNFLFSIFQLSELQRTSMVTSS